MNVFLPAACGMVIGWVVIFFFLLGRLAFGLTFYQPHSEMEGKIVKEGRLAFGLTFYQSHSEMVLNRVKLLGRDI